MSDLNIQASELNEIIRNANPYLPEMLSARGKSIYFPQRGILAQAAEAKGKAVNATIGIALEDNGAPMCLDCISQAVIQDSNEIFPYAPSPGRPDIRATWKKMIYQKNPALKDIAISMPIVSCALTHGLSMCGYLFINEGDRFYTPDLLWENYQLMYENAYGTCFHTFPTFNLNNGFNVAGLKELLQTGPTGKRIVSLNFPNNPTGYTVSPAEAEQIRDVIYEAADAGNNIVIIIDDAYFGLVFEPGILTESIFPYLANLHERVLTIKIDGSTKEDYVWGFRVGFITYAIKGGTPALYTALEAKTAGAIRGNISNSPNISQALLNQAYNSRDYEAQKRQKYATLKRRYDQIKIILSTHPEYTNAWDPLPFNSGYFMCLKPKKVDPELVRKLLLKEYSTGVIVLNDVIRVAYSSTPFDKLETLFANIYQAIMRVENNN